MYLVFLNFKVVDGLLFIFIFIFLKFGNVNYLDVFVVLLLNIYLLKVILYVFKFIEIICWFLVCLIKLWIKIYFLIYGVFCIWFMFKNVGFCNECLSCRFICNIFDNYRLFKMFWICIFWNVWNYW